MASAGYSGGLERSGRPERPFEEAEAAVSGETVPEIHGHCDPRFSTVRDAFAAGFALHGEVGAAVSVLLEGRPVVDLWAGWADAARSRPWQRDTLVNVFSVGKAMTALCAHLLAERGQLDLDAPVARYWPEFAQGGKAGLPVRMLLNHQAGLPAVREVLPEGAMLDWQRMTSELARQQPWWPPGTRHGYHINTFGFLVGEVVRRISGRSLGTFFRDEIAGPLELDFHFGIGPEHDARIAEFLWVTPGIGTILPPGSGSSSGSESDLSDEQQLMLRHVYLNPRGLSGDGTVNTRAWRAAEFPSTNGHANARSIARVFGALAAGGNLGGTRILERESLERAIRPESDGIDAVIMRPSRFGLGFQLTQPERRVGPNPRTFGHFGAGGSLGFADPDAALGIGYVMNKMGPRWQNPRNRGILDAIYASL